MLALIKRIEVNNVYFVVMSVRDGFLPYGPEYDDVVNFVDKDDGYSRTVYFRQKRFLFGCRYYRRFWVRCSPCYCCKIR